MYQSPRSGRVISEPIDVDGVKYIEILYSHNNDSLTKGSIVQWWENEFPSHFVKIPKEKEHLALEGKLKAKDLYE